MSRQLILFGLFALFGLFSPLLPNVEAQQRSGGRSAKQQASTYVGKTSTDPFKSIGPFKAKNRIDSLIAVSLKRQRLEPEGLCSDEVFVRRLFLDVIGTLPTAEEVRAFLDDTRSTKRAELIDRLLSRPEFADYWTLKWCDLLRVKAEFPINLWPAGAMSYYRWIHDAVRTGMPYDRFAYELLTADGSNFRDGASNFYRAVQSKDAETLAETVAQTFLGVRTGPWPPEKLAQLAVFFSRVGYKESAEWKEEIVFWTRKPLDSPDVVFPDGSRGTVRPNQDPRGVLADWLVSPTNQGFNRNIANRIWTWLFGRGLVHEADDFRDDNPPIHPELLDYLCEELVKGKYDLKRLYRLILNSATYQQSSISTSADAKASESFATYPIRRLEAEVLQDALAQIFDIPVSYTSEVPEPYTFIPARYRTILLADASVTSSFLEMFGRPTRDSGLDSDRNNGVTESQQLFLLNSTEVNSWVGRFLAKYRNVQRRPDEYRRMLDDVWLTLLSRYPTSEEVRIVTASFRQSDEQGPRKMQDLVWSLLNTKEFLCKH